MNLKSKLFGFGAAAVLSLGMVSGAMAQASSDAFVNLDEGMCQLSVDAGSANFGTWTWDGTAYVLDSGSSNTADLTGTVTSEWDNSCKISVKSDGLKAGASHIPPGNIKVTTTTSPLFNNVPLSTGWQGADGFAGGPVGAKFTLTSVPNGASPEQHDGTIDFQIGNGA